jgi:hypothetical protein
MKRSSSKHTGMYLLLGVGAIAAYLFYSEKNAAAATSAPAALPASGGSSATPGSTTIPTVVIPGGVSVNGNTTYPITATVDTQTDPLNIRNAPSLSGTVIGFAPLGSTLFIESAPVSGDGSQTLNGVNVGWAPVLLPDGTSGYASMVYLGT